jgi:hypothetical protein
VFACFWGALRAGTCVWHFAVGESFRARRWQGGGALQIASRRTCCAQPFISAIFVGSGASIYPLETGRAAPNAYDSVAVMSLSPDRGGNPVAYSLAQGTGQPQNTQSVIEKLAAESLLPPRPAPAMSGQAVSSTALPQKLQTVWSNQIVCQIVCLLNSIVRPHCLANSMIRPNCLSNCLQFFSGVSGESSGNGVVVPPALRAPDRRRAPARADDDLDSDEEALYHILFHTDEPIQFNSIQLHSHTGQ